MPPDGAARSCARALSDLHSHVTSAGADLGEGRLELGTVGSACVYLSVCVCVCVIICVCVCDVYVECMSVCMCVCVCVRERERAK